MISSSYDINEFIERVKGKDYPEIIEAAEREAKTAEDRSYNVKGAKRAREKGSTDYVRILKGLLFFLRQGIKPGGLDDYEFQKFEPIFENLVEKEQMKEGVLEFFED